ncbi:MAG TPA: hypothetical protein VID04_06655 [Methylomirabilota bacterium]|jgi:hypothetical protein
MSRPAFVAALGLTGTLVLFGCARLAIRVDVLDSGYWASPKYVESLTTARIADTEQAIRDGRFIGQREAMKEDLRKVLLDQSEANPKNARPQDVKVPLKFVDPLMSGFGGTIDDGFGRARGYFQDAFAKVQAATEQKTQADREARMREAKDLFAKGSETLALLTANLTVGLRDALKASKPGQELTAAENEAVRTFSEQARAGTQGLIGAAGLLDDPRAASVVYAPDEQWKGRFNQTVCRGSGGNTDCAVKMEGLGDFTLKGVRLDATRITQATFTVARQTIQTVAAVYGIPLPAPSPAAATGGQGADASALVDLDSPIKRQRDASTAALQLRLARLAMFETIVTQRSALRGGDAARAQAIKAIKAVVEANRKQLDPTPAQ